MEETRDDAGQAEHGPSNSTWWTSDFMEKFESVTVSSQEEPLSNRESPRNFEQDGLCSQTASQVLWSTGMLSEPIPNGFYSVLPDKRLKEHFECIPTLDELHALCSEGFKADIILVDSKRDKNLSRLKQWTVASVKGLGANPAAMIKKIAGLVSDFYKRPSVESPAKAALEETSHMFENRSAQLLGQIRHGSCRARAILFKVLADTAGLDSRLMVGLPNDSSIEGIDFYKHMSVLVVLNSIEFLVDLMRFSGQLMPLSTKAICMAHVSATCESENDSCDSPLEPNSPYGFSEGIDLDSAEKDKGLQFYRKLEVPALQTLIRSNSTIDRKFSSHSDPNIAATFWRRSRRKPIAEQRTASSSPEHPSFRARGRSMLNGEKNSPRDYVDDASSSSCRSDGMSKSEARRMRRKSISITPGIGDDIVRAVRAMNENMKHDRLLRDHQGVNRSLNDRSDDFDLHKNTTVLLSFDVHVWMGSLFKQSEFSGGGSGLYNRSRNQMNPQMAMSLPSSPRQYRSQNEGIGPSAYTEKDRVDSAWNKVLESHMFTNKSLLPFEEWNIDSSELTVGTRVGIGFFGEVFRGLWNGTDVAIKVFLEQELTVETIEDFCNEISILSRLRHPNVILFLGACTKPPRLSMITEYMEMGSLYYLIHGQKKELSWRRKLKMLRDICRMKIVHCDLKSANCLVNKHWTVKICDFGLSKILTEGTVKDSSSAGTPEWMAPELIRNEPFTEKSDIFSFGVIMWELCTLSRPWLGVPPERVVYAVAHEGSRLDLPEGPLGKLISDCWAEPQERPSCQEILCRLLDCEYSLC
ncbi:hypothetical protein ACFE04_018520 [Oxalis oulophora]